jgi:7-cyano-7-deazaguanine reductase
MNRTEIEGLARKGLEAALPPLEKFPSQFTDYLITHHVPEYTALCPKTGHPDFGVITVEYVPKNWCVELKAFKYYIHAYRNIGISYENATNRILRDLDKALAPKWVRVTAAMTPRGGISSTITAQKGRKPAFL